MRLPFLLMTAFAAAVVPHTVAEVPPGVVISEIFYEPEDKTKATEFVELHNPTAVPFDLSGWRFAEGIRFVFPNGAQIAPGEFAVLCEDAAAFTKEFGVKPLGQFDGSLSNQGEKLALRDATGAIVASVRYAAGFPWPGAAAGGGSSLELINPTLDPNLGGSWASSGFRSAEPQAAVLVAASDPQWRWRKLGPGEVVADWRNQTFSEDPSWKTAQTSIGYGDDDDRTVLADMRGAYSTLLLRHIFTIQAGAMPDTLLLRVRVDDGCVLWINGQQVARLHVGGHQDPFRAEEHEAGGEFEEVLLTSCARYLRPGANLLAVQAMNATLASSDFTFDCELRTPPAKLVANNRPAPGAANSTGTQTAPPAFLEVQHTPGQPRAKEAVKITARLSNGGGVTGVTLRYQIVEPGRYIRRDDPTYENAWADMPMHDDATGGDPLTDDGIFTATLPGSVQVHRRLIRYRVEAVSRLGETARAPRSDDESPNFAYFAYDGAPEWKGAVDPGKTPVLTFPAELLTTLPTYHLLAATGEAERSQWDGESNRKPFLGTLISDGRVYDHIHYRNRGQGSTYVAGKNKWDFKFNRGHEFIPRDPTGRPYRRTWDEMKLNACASPWVQTNRGMAGLDEAASFRLFELAGVPSPRTHPVHFRVIDHAEETSTRSQFEGDLWGLYLALEEPDGSFLDERDLRDGNVFRIANGGGERKHHARKLPADGSDWKAFIEGSRRERSESWWRGNLDLQSFYSFQASNRLTGNVDLRESDNHYFYHGPDGRWAPIPWDLDMMFIPRSHQSGRIEQSRCLDLPALRLEYQNRCREVLDLLCSDATPEGGQFGQVVAEYTALMYPHGSLPGWPELDACMWNQHPRSNARGVFYRNPVEGGPDGGWQRKLATPDFFGFARFVVEFCTAARPEGHWKVDEWNPSGYGYGYLAAEAADAMIPRRPTIRMVGSTEPSADKLRFQCSPFDDPQGAETFGAMQWRIGETTAPGAAGYVVGGPWRYEIEKVWASPEIDAFANEQLIPADVCRPGVSYRARVRLKDQTGRWSHWSEPVQFVPKAKSTAAR